MVEPISMEALVAAKQRLMPIEKIKIKQDFIGKKIDVEQYLLKYGLEIVKIKPHGSSMLYCLKHCVFDESHVNNEAAIGQCDDGKLFYQCFHDSCQSRTWQEARQIISSNEPLFERPICPRLSDTELINKKPEISTLNNVFEPQEEDEQKPLDIFGDPILSGKSELERGCCPDVIYNFAVDNAERLGVELSMLIFPSLVVCASLIDDRFKIQPKKYDTDWKESARLWAAIIAEPGEKKSPSIDCTTKSLKRIEKRLFLEDQETMKIYEADLEEYNRLKKSKNGTGGMEKPEKPPQRRKMVDDITIEALSNVLNDNPEGILCLKDELSGWIGSFDAYRGGKGGLDRALWLELYNGGNKLYDRVGRGRMFIENWSACLLGGIQPGPMRRLMGQITDDGLLQRFMVVYGGRKGDGEDRPPNIEYGYDYQKLIDKLSKLKPKGTDVFKFSDGAAKYRSIVANLADKIMLLPDTPGAFKAHLSKNEGLYSRLVLTFHIIEAVARNEYPKDEVSEQTALMVCQLMLDYLIPNACRFYGEMIGTTESSEDAMWIAGHILAKKLEKITQRDIYRAFRKLRNDQTGICDAMHHLETAGWVKPKKMDSKRQITQWAIDSRVHDIFSKRAKLETDDRKKNQVKVRKAIKFIKEGK